MLEIIHNCRHPASFKIGISKVQDFRNFELSPMDWAHTHCGGFLMSIWLKYFEHKIQVVFIAQSELLGSVNVRRRHELSTISFK